MRGVSACVVLGVLWVGAGVAEGGLTLNKKCGEKMCGEKEFCSPYDNLCRPCESVCELGSHNYQEEMCQKDCQDYLHDRLYVKKTDQPIESLHAEMEKLYQLLTVVLVIAVLILVILAGVLAYVVLEARKRTGAFAEKIRKKISVINAVTRDSAGGNVSDAQKAAVYKIGDNLRLDMTVGGGGGGVVGGNNNMHACSNHRHHPDNTSTPVSSRPPRYPTEDTTLECGAYDNPALTPSPVFDKTQGDPMTVTNMVVTKRESSF